MQRSATPFTPVRFRPQPPIYLPHPHISTHKNTTAPTPPYLLASLSKIGLFFPKPAKTKRDLKGSNGVEMGLNSNRGVKGYAKRPPGKHSLWRPARAACLCNRQICMEAERQNRRSRHHHQNRRRPRNPQCPLGEVSGRRI